MVDDIMKMDNDNAYKTRGGMKKLEEDGATSCGSALQSGGAFSDGTQMQDGSNPNAGEWVGPLKTKKNKSDVIKKGSVYMPDTLKEGKKSRTIHITQEQMDYLMEVTSTSNVGDYSYTAPGIDIPKTDPTMSHKNILKDKKLSNG